MMCDYAYVSVCACLCGSMCVCVCHCVFVYVHERACFYVHLSQLLRGSLYVCMRVRVPACVSVYVCSYVAVCVR